MRLTEFQTWMANRYACREATEWVAGKTAKKAWVQCERGDWMLWCLSHTSIDQREVVRIACDIALSVLPLSDDPRVAACIDAAEGWCEGTVTPEELHTARRASYGVASAAAVCAAEAAYSTSHAGCAIDAAAVATDAYAYAYACAEGATAWNQARADARREIADLVRERVTAEEFAALVEAPVEAVAP